MPYASLLSGPHHEADLGAPRRQTLRRVLDDVAHLLPSQGPIGVFVHHNTLHAFEHLTFEEAVVTAGRLLGAEPFMPEAWYRAQHEGGRILDEDLDAVIARERPQEGSEERALLGGRTTATRLRRSLLTVGLVDADGPAVAFLIDELRVHGSASREKRRLWDELRARVHRLPTRVDDPADVGSLQRPRDLIRAATAVDLDEHVHPLLITATAAFLDQGVAYWPMADREAGLLGAVARTVVGGPALPVPLIRPLRLALAPWMSALSADDPAAHAEAAEALLLDELARLGVDDAQLTPALAAEALALPGWAGMMRQLEREPSLAPHRCPPCRLVDFLALRVLLMRLAAEAVLERHGSGVSLSAWLDELRAATARGTARESDPLGRAYRLFQALDAVGVDALALSTLPDQALCELERELLAIGDVERRRLWHLAYERRHRQGVLSALAAHRLRAPVAHGEKPPPSAQVMFCLDEREESLRRHLEEVAPQVETIGVAGFFGVAVAFQGLDDGRPASQCPVVQTPRHAVREISVPEQEAVHARYAARRLLLAQLRHGGFFGSRSLVRGAVATALLGVVAAAPLVLRLLSPRSAQLLSRGLRRLFLPRPATKLAIVREAEEEGSLALFPGFTLEEMADRVGRVLEDTGLLRRLSRVVAVIGHGSSSLNNPHASAYDCGACGGRPGGPNAHLFATMANDHGVRRELSRRGLPLPDDTLFVGGYHDTASDDVRWFDLDRVPPSHQADVDALVRSVDEARARSAQERCRRFLRAPLTLSPEAALRHVQGRSQDLAEPRVECGHATNAVCVVGRRALTRGLFLDRRAFLVEYDPSLDDASGAVLGRTLQAVTPVVAGINLEYYFSYVDNERYGCGTKLPHNVTGLVGVMNGPESDLRTGLPWQMVEIHEPVRLLLVAEASASTFDGVCASHPGLAALVAGRWISVALIDPDSGAVHEVEAGADGLHLVAVPVPERPLPSAPDSFSWYRGRREHLPIAEVAAGLGPQAAEAGGRP